MPARTQKREDAKQEKRAPYYERLEAMGEYEYPNGRFDPHEVRVFDDTDETGEVKVQVHQQSGRGRKVAVLTVLGEDGFDELIADLQEARAAMG